MTSALFLLLIIAIIMRPVFVLYFAEKQLARKERILQLGEHTEVKEDIDKPKKTK